MTKGKEKSPRPQKPGATPAPQERELSVGPLTQLLIKARQRIVDPRHWSRGAYARDAQNVSVDVMDPEAVCWCAAGSLERECGHHMPGWLENDKALMINGKTVPKPNVHYQSAHYLLEVAAGDGVRAGSITALNDGGGHARVMQMFNKAIGLAKGK